jgi:hypothetical protein
MSSMPPVTAYGPLSVTVTIGGRSNGRNVAISDQKIFETVTLPWVVKMLR